MKYYYTATISYQGTNYFGWQKQPTLPTIQQTLENCFKQVFPAEQVQFIGASRTDARVHAIAQIAQIITTLKIMPEELQQKLNNTLPNDIRIKKIKNSHSKFMVIYQVTSKEYFYLFSNQPQVKKEHLNIVNFQEPLDIETMQSSCSIFLGTHSFHNFQYKMNPKNSPIRSIHHCAIIKDPPYAPICPYPVFALEISGNGFLKQMVRIIMGTLLNIGQGLQTPDAIYSAFHPESNLKLGFIAPAYGLHLKEIHY